MSCRVKPLRSLGHADLRDQALEPSSRIFDGGERGDDALGVLRLPTRERRRQQRIAVGEVPIEAALGDAERARQRFDAGGVEPATLDRFERRLLPIRSPEAPIAVAGTPALCHVGLIPYACVLTNRSRAVPYACVWGIGLPKGAVP